MDDARLLTGGCTSYIGLLDLFRMLISANIALQARQAVLAVASRCWMPAHPTMELKELPEPKET